jgi:DNA-binding IclR family transcriptional regulator
VAGDAELPWSDEAGGPLVTLPPTTSVIGKVAVILDVIAQSDGRIGLSELARQSGLPKPTVHRLCGDLVAWGVVERAGDAFRLGAKLFDLGQRAPTRRWLRDAALPAMEALRSATGHTVHLAVAMDGEVIYVEKLPGLRNTTPSSVAGRVPLHCTATGKCLLAFGDQEAAAAAMKGPLIGRTKFTLRDPRRLRIVLDAVRKHGWADEQQEYVVGYCSIGAPVFDRTGAAIAALAVTVPLDAFDEQRLATPVMAAARDVTRRIGGALLAT